MDSPSVALIGAGAMGGALVRGWLQAIRCGGGLIVRVHDPAFHPELAAELDKAGAIVNPLDSGVVDAVVLAVKPQQFPEAIATAKPYVGPETLVMSVMAGVTLAALTRAFDTERVLRAMPNTPGQIGRGVTAYAPGPGCTAQDKALAEQLLRPFGMIEALASERQMDVVTAVSGSGPAYVFLLAEVLAAAAEKEGLDPETAARIARQTVAGAGALLLETGESPAVLRRQVTSPGGTTQAALDVLQSADGLAAVIRRAVSAAANRSRELGRGVEA